MFVRSLSLRDFRSWEHAAVDLAPGQTVFVGANGNGKTNILESLGYLSTLSSHRVANDAPLIRSGAAQAQIGAAVVNAGHELRLDVELNQGAANRARINRSPVRRPREILGVLRTVLFAPEDLALVRGDPGERRRFLDELSTSRRPALAAVRADYDRVLRQRSALLKSAGRRRVDAELATLDTWDGHLAAHGAQLIAARIELVAALAPLLTQVYAQVAPGSRSATMEYRTSLAGSLDPDFARPDRPGELTDLGVLEAAFAAELARARPRELERGVCLVGPHRDELELSLGIGPAKGFASHGESWSFALALRLAAFELLRAEGSDPVLLLDDVFAELDSRRRSALAGVAAAAEQVLVTAAVEDDIPSELRGSRIQVTAQDDGGLRRSVFA